MSAHRTQDALWEVLARRYESPADAEQTRLNDQREAEAGAQRFRAEARSSLLIFFTDLQADLYKLRSRFPEASFESEKALLDDLLPILHKHTGVVSNDESHPIR